MKLAGEYVFDAPRDSVWRALLDPVVLASVLPGCEKLELVGENEYEGALKIKVGPVQGDFQGKVKLEDLVAPASYTMQVDGRGGPGFVKATAEVRLEERGAQTAMFYDSDAQVGGRIASVGQRLLDSSAKAIIKQSLQGLDGVIAAATATARDTGVDEAAAQVAAAQAAEKPTQGQLAANVAKEVARDLAPAGGRWLLIAVVVVLALLALYFLVQ